MCWFVALAVVLLSSLRFAHYALLWADEDYHLAAALQMLHGRMPYRDFWYDKPPLTACYYLLNFAHFGWLLRLLDSAYICACCAAIFYVAKQWWGAVEGFIAALLLAFYTTFYLPSAVIPFAADAILVLPHLLAIWLVLEGKPLAAGSCAGIAFLANTKALFILMTCSVFLPLVQWPILVASFVCTCGAGFGLLEGLGAWPGYVEQVWRWGLAYTQQPPVSHPWRTGLNRTVNWAGFHSAIVVAAAYALSRKNLLRRWQLATWIVLSFMAVALGSRFAPHYFLQLLPPLVVAGARGMVLLWQRWPRILGAVFAVLMVIPVIRFGPRYVSLLLQPTQPHWADTAMDRDSQDVARTILSSAQKTDTLLVWGYRPDVYVYTRLMPDGRFWDSQPLTGVPADRHLSETTIYAERAAANRTDLVHSRPIWIVDGLGRFNPTLALERYPDLQEWRRHYRLFAQTALSSIYRRND